jgi:nitrate reductase beta subunit
MKVRAQIGKVLNLDKCIGCHTCSVTCKNVWTSREGMEYAWFNNVETKPGIGYPKEWENQDKWNGGWVRKKNGKIQPKIGGRWRVLANIFANPTCRRSMIITNRSPLITTICKGRRNENAAGGKTAFSDQR